MIYLALFTIALLFICHCHDSINELRGGRMGQEEALIKEDVETSNEDVNEPYSLTELKAMTVRELRSIAKELHIKGYSASVKEGKTSLATFIYINQ